MSSIEPELKPSAHTKYNKIIAAKYVLRILFHINYEIRYINVKYIT